MSSHNFFFFIIFDVYTCCGIFTIRDCQQVLCRSWQIQLQGEPRNGLYLRVVRSGIDRTLITQDGQAK